MLAILRAATAALERRGIAEPRLSAEHLLAAVLACRRLDLYLRFDQLVTPSDIAAFRGLTRRRLTGEPIQYITGSAGFRGLELQVDRRVLIPRPETEQVVGHVLSWAAAEGARGRAPAGGWRLLDVGTGSGAIACALAHELPGLRWVVGTDRSVAALEVARGNGLAAGAARARWVAADGFLGLRPGTFFDAIVANPPYLADGDRDGLDVEIGWEPPGALFAGPRGDEALLRLVAEAAAWLRPGGLLALEVGSGQAADVAGRIRATPGLEHVATIRDHAGHERGVLAIAAPDSPPDR
ncbi:MAG: peptide chain release factor N(5)-glutamine methyltransferase [Gemmatimonadota bacterium]